MAKSALIIDDNTNNLLLEKDMLELAGFEVYLAENATLGISLAKEKRPGIIIMDMRLPDMRGSDAAKILLQYPETRDIPVVFVTASVLSEGIEEIRTIPNAVFISKPINTRTFAAEVIQLMK